MPRARSRTGHPGTRASHTRRTKHGTTRVSQARIRYPKAQQRQQQVARQVQRGKSPLLWGAGIATGWGALEAILGGRFFTAGMLFGLAGIFLVSHVAWSHHKKRQASKPARQSAAEQRREARAKARQERQRQDGGFTDEDIQKLHESSTRSVVRWRAAKEGVRRKWDTIRGGQEYAAEQAEQRKAALRWPRRSAKRQAAPALAEPVRIDPERPVAPVHPRYGEPTGKPAVPDDGPPKPRRKRVATEAEYSEGLDKAVAESKEDLARHARERHDRFNTFGDKEEVLR